MGRIRKKKPTEIRKVDLTVRPLNFSQSMFDQLLEFESVAISSLTKRMNCWELAEARKIKTFKKPKFALQPVKYIVASLYATNGSMF